MGLAESAAEFFPEAAWQRRIVHWYRNVFSHVPSTKVREVGYRRTLESSCPRKPRALVMEIKSLIFLILGRPTNQSRESVSVPPDYRRMGSGNRKSFTTALEEPPPSKVFVLPSYRRVPVQKFRLENNTPTIKWLEPVVALNFNIQPLDKIPAQRNALFV
jgi:hypothetical protein